MSLPDRQNPYSFDDFLSWRKSIDYYLDDKFLQKIIRHFSAHDWDNVDNELKKMSAKVSFNWRDLSDAIAVPEKRPYVMHYDGHNHRIDRIVRPAETSKLESEIFSQAIFSEKTNPWVRLAKMYLIYQNGEACVACPIVCTEGLIALLERYADTPVLKNILKHCKEGVNGDFGIGAQYLSEIQGGSDVPSNLLEAVKEGDHWRVYGTKFFCSATHADYAVVTAKPKGSENIGLFIVPSWFPGDKEKEKRNGYTIERIKWKMGTSELTTAEITFNGAVAYQAGPLDRGLANVVGIVLTYSRLTVGLSAAASMTRAAREAKGYAERRSAFGLNINLFPMLKGQLKKLDLYAKRTTAGAFKLYHQFLALPGGLKGGVVTDEPEGIRKNRFRIRELIMLQKITTSWDATDMLRLAMSVFGGHGVMEDFSSLPRLFRDAAINELWEGPRNVLLTQIHRDLSKAAPWYPPEIFVKDILSGADKKVIADLSDKMKELSESNLLGDGDSSITACEKWDTFCHDLYHAYQDMALRDINEG
jgi:alkylation response protein AidB-like acyl-CoA dehydrogenase